MLRSPKKVKDKQVFYEWLLNHSIDDSNITNPTLKPYILATYNYISGCSCCAADDYIIFVSEPAKCCDDMHVKASVYKYRSKQICLNKLHHTSRCNCPDFDYSNILPILIIDKHYPTQDSFSLKKYEYIYDHDWNAENVLQKWYNGEYVTKILCPINQDAKNELDQLAENYVSHMKYDQEYNQPIRDYIKQQELDSPLSGSSYTLQGSSIKNLDYYYKDVI